MANQRNPKSQKNTKPSTKTMWVAAPRGQHKKFRILVRTKGKKTETLKSKDLVLINREYLSKNISREEAKRQCTALLRSLRGASKPAPSTANGAVLEKAFNERYRLRERKNKADAKREYENAVGKLGRYSLLSVTADQAREQLKDLPPIKRHRYSQRLNEVFRWLGRSVHIPLKRPPAPNIKFLTIEEFSEVVSELEENIALFCWALFATGGRMGEVIALNKKQVFGRPPSVSVMFTRAWNRKSKSYTQTKNVRAPQAPVLPDGARQVVTWAALSDLERQSMANVRAENSITKACLELWPYDPLKHLSFRDLRHCYAMELVRRGFSLSEVGRFLGNSLDVTQRYYAGKVAQPEEIKNALNRLN